jgi:hypothetical protein
VSRGWESIAETAAEGGCSRRGEEALTISGFEIRVFRSETPHVVSYIANSRCW